MLTSSARFFCEKPLQSSSGHLQTMLCQPDLVGLLLSSRRKHAEISRSNDSGKPTLIYAAYHVSANNALQNRTVLFVTMCR